MQVILKSFRLAKICFSPSQYAVEQPLYKASRKPTVHSKV